MLEKFTDKIVPAAARIQDNVILTALRDGFMAAFPATMFASFAMIIQYLPAMFGFDQFLPAGMMDFLNAFLGPAGNATMSLSSIFICFGVAYHYASKTVGNKLFFGLVTLTFFFMPVVTVIISYFAIAWGFVPRPIGITGVWTTPFFLPGWIGTGSVMGGVLQLVNLAVSTLIWFPFIKVLDNSYLKEEQDSADEEDDMSIFDLERE